MDSANNIILPKDRVLFIGGHENFISKFKKEYPGWVYLTTEERNSNKVRGDFLFVVAKTDHLSHNILERAYAYLDKNVPTIYTKSTNVNRAVHEIQEGYKKILLKKAC